MLELGTTPLDKHLCDHTEYVLHIKYCLVSPLILIYEQTEASEVKPSFKYTLSSGNKGRAEIMPLSIPPDVSCCISVSHLSS